MRRTTLRTGETYEQGADGVWRPVAGGASNPGSTYPSYALRPSPSPWGGPQGGSAVRTAALQQGASVPGGCSGFVKAVAEELGIHSLEGLDANQITWRLRSWEFLGNTPWAALQAANQGKFVVAGITRNGHGHVVVVLPGAMAPSGYPYVAVQHWSSRGGNRGIGVGEDMATAFGRGELPRVVYGAHPIAVATAVPRPAYARAAAPPASSAAGDPKFAWLRSYGFPPNAEGYEMYWAKRQAGRVG